ncbi:MAG: hypothetical protein KIT60_06830 [Burkholderiaceae bacterium]|nr:hypothetical protein [Burkholderiaceae bacterium]
MAPPRLQRETLLQFVADLVAHAESLLVDVGIKPDQARQLGMELAFRLCEQYSKTYMYVPTPNNMRQALRNQAVAAEYNQDGPKGVLRRSNDRIHQLAAQHDLTAQQVRNVLNLHGALQADEPRRGGAFLPGFEPR